MDVEPGDIVGVLGKNGAGKTTLLELVLGFTPATTGSAQMFGHDSYRCPAPRKRASASCRSRTSSSISSRRPINWR